VYPVPCGHRRERGAGRVARIPGSRERRGRTGAAPHTDHGERPAITPWIESSNGRPCWSFSTNEANDCKTNENPAPAASKRVRWHKGKLVGAKPPLRPKHVWSIRTKLQSRGARVIWRVQSGDRGIGPASGRVNAAIAKPQAAKRNPKDHVSH
jgi:hypothetical protein